VAPVDPLHLIEVIAGLYSDPEGRPIGRVIAFVGARGGAGSSALCHNVGWCIAEEQHINTEILDFDLAYGTLGLDFNDEAGQSIADALTAPERLDEVLLERLLIRRGDHLSLFTAPAVLERDYNAGLNAYESVIDAVRQISPCVIVDLPHSWEPWVKATLIGADDIVVVATPDLASLRNAKNLMEILRHNRANDAPPKLVLNQVGQPKRPEIPVKDFAETFGVEPSIVLPFDPALFGQAANNGQMLAELGQKSPAVEAVRRLAGLVTGRKQASGKTALSLFSMLKGKKRA
jgi:pilus assembly protein CpaE